MLLNLIFFIVKTGSGYSKEIFSSSMLVRNTQPFVPHFLIQLCMQLHNDSAIFRHLQKSSILLLQKILFTTIQLLNLQIPNLRTKMLILIDQYCKLYLLNNNRQKWFILFEIQEQYLVWYGWHAHFERKIQHHIYHHYHITIINKICLNIGGLTLFAMQKNQ